MNAKLKLFALCLLSLTVFVLLTCDSDTGTGPEKEKPQSAVKGTVTFTGEWPAAPSEVRMVASVSFPPASADDLILGESIPQDVSSYDYTLKLDPGKYRLIGVAWRTSDAEWTLSNICGVYIAGGDPFIPGVVTLGNEDSVAEDIDFSVDRSIAKPASQAKIEGSVHFEGQWPQEYTHAIVVGSTNDPFSDSFSLFDLSFGNVIEKGTQSINYTINAQPATYQAIGVLFFNVNESISGEAFYYSQNVNALSIVQVTVGANQTVAGPDFDIKFTVANSGIKGTVIFTGSWPAPPAEVRLVATETFPPSLDDLIIGESLPANQQSANYFFHLAPGSYKVVGVAWRAESQSWALTSICGAYFAGEDSLSPTEVVIPSEDSVIENVNMKVNRTKAREVTDTKIAGSIEFQGEWPSDIIEARVIATTKFNIFPTELPTMLDLGFSDGIEPGTAQVDYLIQAFPGTFVATGVLFFREGQKLTMNDIFYSLDVNGLDLSQYKVERNKTADGPDFVIQF